MIFIIKLFSNTEIKIQHDYTVLLNLNQQNNCKMTFPGALNTFEL